VESTGGPCDSSAGAGIFFSAVLCAFDLLELDGEDLRRLPIEVRKAGLAQLLRSPHPGIALNEHYIGDGAIVYRQA
jgi:ATP-dependent DNA ligase